jgi:hypothetical protein
VQRFLLGLSLGVLFAIGLDIREFAIDATGPWYELGLELLIVLIPAVLIAITFAIPWRPASLVGLAAVFGYWVQDERYDHYFGYSADGFVSNYVMAFVGIVLVATALVGTSLHVAASDR